MTARRWSGPVPDWLQVVSPDQSMKVPEPPPTQPGSWADPVPRDEEFRRVGKDSLDDAYTLIMEYYWVFRDASRRIYSGSYTWEDAQQHTTELANQWLRLGKSFLAGFWIGMGTPIPEARITGKFPLKVRLDIGPSLKARIVDAYRHGDLATDMRLECFPSREGGAALEGTVERIGQEIGLAISIPGGQPVGTYACYVRDLYGEVIAKATVAVVP